MKTVETQQHTPKLFQYASGHTEIEADRRPVKDVLRDLNYLLAKEDLLPEEGGFSDHSDWDKEVPAIWPELYRLACFPVRGGSEGHYVHIELIIPTNESGKREAVCISFAKAFQGMEFAGRVAAACARLLGA
jgi:hypothetical protein